MPIAELPSVLIVDDNDATCTLIAAILRREFTVDIAGDGTEAIERLRVGRYAAILLDLRMPPPDGFALLDYLQSNQPESLRRVLIVTAALSPKELDRVRLYKIAGIIPKPFEIEVILQAVKDCAGPGQPPLGTIFANGMILLLADWIGRRL